MANYAVFTANNASWAWPAWVTSLTAETLGGGGGGGGEAGYPSGGGGGKGGGYARGVITKGAESTLAIVVGALGTAGASTGGTGGSGGESSVSQGGSKVVSAPGGVGGVGAASNNHSGAGATTENGVWNGTYQYAGGNGGAGLYTTPRSGGGGGAAGYAGVGGAASGATQGTANTTSNWTDGAQHSGNGANGRTTTAGAGIAGSNYGGGGSGGLATAATNRAGGAGAAGYVVLSWDTPVASFPLDDSVQVHDDVVGHLDAPPLAPLAFDSARVAEYRVTRLVTNLHPSVYDSVRVHDAITARWHGFTCVKVHDDVQATLTTVQANLTANIHDDATVAETVKAVRSPVVAKPYDAVGVAEAWAAQGVRYGTTKVAEWVDAALTTVRIKAQPYDAVRVTEYRKTAIPLTPHLADSVAVAEFRKTAIPITPHLADSVAVHDDAQGLPSGGANLTAVRYDDVRIAENVKPVLSPVVARPVDGVAVAETRKAVPSPLAPHVSDGVTVAESRKVGIPITPHVSDGVSVAEVAKGAVSPVAAHLADSVLVTDYLRWATWKADRIAVHDDVQAELLATSALTANRFDPVYVSEFRSAVLSPLRISVFDAVTVSEFRKAVLSPVTVRVQDNLRVAEFRKGVVSPVAAHLIDQVVVSEWRDLQPTLKRIYTLLYDSIRAVEPDPFQAQLKLARIKANLFDGVGVAEFRKGPFSPLAAHLADLLKVLDDLDGHITTIGKVEFLAWDEVRAAEAVFTRLSKLKIAIQDYVAVHDDLHPAVGPLIARVFDSVRVSEWRKAIVPLTAQRFDSARVQDVVVSAQLKVVRIHAEIADALRVTEYVKAIFRQIAAHPFEPIRVSDVLRAVFSPGLLQRTDAATVQDIAWAVLNITRLYGSAHDDATVEDALSGALEAYEIGGEYTDSLSVSERLLVTCVPPEALITAGTRIFVVPAEDRTFAVADDRTFVVPADERVFTDQ